MSKYLAGGACFAFGAVASFFLIDWLVWRGLNGKKIDIKAPVKAQDWFADQGLRVVPDHPNYTINDDPANTASGNYTWNFPSQP